MFGKILWWLVETVFEVIANEILEQLQDEVADKRQRWEENYERLEKEIQVHQKKIEEELVSAQKQLTYKKVKMLHEKSVKLANRTYSLLQDSKESLDAMGRAIVEAAKQRKILEKRKRETSYSERNKIEREIESLHQLRDEILVPDKDQIKQQRDHFFNNVRKLNIETGKLRDLKAQLAPKKTLNNKKHGQEGIIKWYNRKKEYGFIISKAGNNDIYFNAKSLKDCGVVNSNDKVRFTLVQREKKMAINITKIVQ